MWRRPLARTSVPSGSAPATSDPVTISAPAFPAAAASASMQFWRTIENIRIGPSTGHSMRAMVLSASSRISRARPGKAPRVAAS